MKKFERLIESFELLTESKNKKTRRRTIPKSKVKESSEEKRKERAKNVTVEFLKSESTGGGQLTKHVFKASSAEKVESDEHEGFVELFNKSGRINDCGCSCSDFQARFAYFDNKSGIHNYDQIRPKNDMFDPHTRGFPETTNPDNLLGIACKHLIKAVSELAKDETK